MRVFTPIARVISLAVFGTVLSGHSHATLLSDFTAAGNLPSDIQPTVANFRVALGGGLNPNTAAPFADGRREINWDGVPDGFSDPNPFPGNFFNGSTPGRARGVVFNPVGPTTGFEVSSNAASGESVAYGFPNEFQVFSPERLFRTVNGNQFDLLFFSPADQITGALTDGFGMVYTDADFGGLPVLDFFNAQGGLLHSITGLATDNFGLGFVGSVFDRAEVARVRVTIGGSGDPLDPNASDAVVMDDFIYGEPQPVPEPGTLALLLVGAAFFMHRRMGIAARAY